MSVGVPEAIAPAARTLWALPAVRPDPETLAAAAAETLDRLRRQADLRHQDQRLLALPEHLLDGAQVHLGLAAAGHAVKQERAEPTLPQGGLQLRPHILLVRVQLDAPGLDDFRLRGQVVGRVHRLDAAHDAAGHAP